MRRARPRLGDYAREAARSLVRARLRTALGVTGITIGIASVIAMISSGEAATAHARSKFEALGTDIIAITASSAGGTGLTLDDATRLGQALASIGSAGPVIRLTKNVSHNGRPVGQTQVQGITREFWNITQTVPEQGRLISDLDRKAAWAVVGAEVAKAIRRAGTSDIEATKIDIGGRFYTVVGTLEHAEQSYALPFVADANDSVFIPIRNAEATHPNARVSMIIARMKAGATDATVHREATRWLEMRLPHTTVEVKSARQLIEQMEAQLEVMTLLLGAIGSISLLVGGIGVMNIMLISVTERRKEIGIRRALGATRGDIQHQFLTESIMLTGTGGMLGIMLGAGATWLICRQSDWAFFMSETSIAIGLGVATTVGIFFGFQPAYQAARVDPIAALQKD